MNNLEMTQTLECVRAQVRLDEFVRIDDKPVDFVYRL
jgi:hypothetical protein